MDAQLLKDTLKAKGITQRELAERIGYTESYVNQAVNGHIEWNRRAVKLIAIELGLTDVEVSDLFGEVLTKSNGLTLPKGKGS